MTKIEALKKTIYNLENDVYKYSWSLGDSCNCGILAKTILKGKNFMKWGFDKIQIKETQLHGWTCFSDRTYCLSTNLKLPLVFAKLKESGFTNEEMRYLEFLSSPSIIKKTGTLKHNEKDHLIKYLKAWVEILEEEKLNSEQGVQASVATEVEQGTKTGNIKIVTKYVAVPTTIEESLPETIYS